MSLLSVHDLSCEQGAKRLFDDATFGIEEGEKVALIGINGSGKSTLLHALMDPKNPHVTRRQSLKITYLPQHTPFSENDTILDHLFKSNTPTAQIIRAYHACLENPDSGDLDTVMAQMDLHQAWDYEARVASVLGELDLHTLSLPMKDLSGGMIKKISLAQCFFEESDLYILDEPTNHLDIKTITWLENTLKRLACTLLMVTHDRYFLDKICTKILEIDQKKIFTYPGNYQTYLEQREARLLQQQKADDTLQSILRVELAWLRRGPKARSTKQKARKQRIDDMQSRASMAQDETLELGVAHRRLGKKILELKDVAFSYGDTPIIQPFSYTFKQGEKIGLLGPNGVGKTTLFNLITQKLQPTSGTIEVGVNTVFGYFDQHSRHYEPGETLYSHIAQIGSSITLHDGSVLSASKLLERFLFPSSMLKTKIEDLSGGERRRLDLVCLLLSNPNFLLFDEPTNDLDITTLSILEDFLLTFSGCVIVISHDRYFMDRVVDQLLVFQGKGKLSHFAGSYSDFEAAQKETEALSTGQKTTAPASKTTPDKEAEKQKKYRIKKLESLIESLESEIKQIQSSLEQGTPTPQAFATAGRQLKDLDERLSQAYSEWESLIA